MASPVSSRPFDPPSPIRAAGAAPPEPCRRFHVTLGEARPSAAPGAPGGRTAPAPAGPLSGPPAPATRLVARLLEGERAVDLGLARALRGGALSPRDLLALQVTVMRHAQELEVASKIVEKVT